MNATLVDTTDNAMLTRWNMLEARIFATDVAIDVLSQQRQRYSDDLAQTMAALDTRTRPATQVSSYCVTASIQLGKTKTYVRRSVNYRGTHFEGTTYRDLYVAVFRYLVREFPDRAQNIQNAMARGARSRKLLSPSPDELFKEKTASWRSRHSVEVGNGWYLDINLSLPRMKRLVRRGLAAVGLSLNRDVFIEWDDRWE